MPSTLKKIINALILVSYLTIALFSLALMMYGPDGRMSDNCPFSGVGVSMCPEDSVAAALQHISTYESFLKVPVSIGLAALIISLLLVVYALCIIFIRLPLLGPPTFAPIVYDSPPVNSYTRKIIRWLSLFENSPSQY